MTLICRTFPRKWPASKRKSCFRNWNWSWAGVFKYFILLNYLLVSSYSAKKGAGSNPLMPNWNFLVTVRPSFQASFWNAQIYFKWDRSGAKYSSSKFENEGSKLTEEFTSYFLFFSCLPCNSRESKETFQVGFVHLFLEHLFLRNCCSCNLCLVSFPVRVRWSTSDFCRSPALLHNLNKVNRWEGWQSIYYPGFCIRGNYTTA